MDIALLSLVFAVAPSAAPEQIVQDLLASNHQRVGVLPVVICRNGDLESTVGSLGPRGRLMARELEHELVNASQRRTPKAEFSVVQERTMLRAMRARGFTIDDFGDAKKVQALAEEAGVDAIVTLTYDEDLPPPQADGAAAATGGIGARADDGTRSAAPTKEHRGTISIRSETLDAIDGTVAAAHDFPDDMTLSRAAYQGESWELRRWVAGRLENRGIEMDGARPFGLGAKWERAQYVHLKKALPHPLEIDDFPFFVGVEVKGQPRLPTTVRRGGKPFYVVELSEGEKYRVMLENPSDAPVYVALFIDGVSSIDRQMVEPGDLETQRHWYLRPHSGPRSIDGWYTIPRDAAGQPGEVQHYDEFQIVPRDESVAAGEDSLGRIGMITAVFYTVGMDGIEQPAENLTPRSIPSSAFGTGLGDRKDATLEFQTRPNRGLILAAVTLHYRTRQELDALVSGDPSDPINFIAPR